MSLNNVIYRNEKKTSKYIYGWFFIYKIVTHIVHTNRFFYIQIHFCLFLLKKQI